MPRTACSVAIVGGGVVGASIAYHLSVRGVHDVLVLDRAPYAGAGSTARATGGFRVQFGSAALISLSLLSRAKLLAFADEVGAECGYVAAGYLWIAEAASELEALRAALAVQRANGVDDAEEIDADAVVALNPAVRRAPLAGGTFCGSDGFIRPLQILDGYRRAAERLGVRFAWDTEVVGLQPSANGRIEAVRTRHEEIAVETVVNAAGPWAQRVASMAGLEIPVMPLRRQVAVTAPTSVLPERMPMTIYGGDGFHLRVRDGRVLLLLPSAGAADPFDDTVEDAWIARVVTLARQRISALADVAIDRTACWAGLYEMTPDGHPIVDVAPGVPNLVLASGSSGHGVMHAPAIGQLVAELIVDGTITSLNPTPFRADRFTSAGANASELL